MSDAIKKLTKLTKMIKLDDPELRLPWRELESLWIEAINSRFQECRSKIKVLDQLAAKAGVNAIERLDDVVPLLFAHTAYKSYPEAFIERRRWDRMNFWLGTLSKYPIEGIDLEGVSDADDWIARLHAAGHAVFATSGTSGKNSFINQTVGDVEFANNATVRRLMLKAQRYPIFILGPRHAPNRPSMICNHLVDNYGRPGAVYFLSNETLKITDLSEMARMRRRIGEGTAAPSDIAKYEEAIKARRQTANASFTHITEAIISHRHEPSIIFGLTPQLYSVVEAARAQGLADGCFHPDTVVATGGGAKGVNLPADHVDQIMRFMGLKLERFVQGYGMQEVSTGADIVEPGRYEFQPWIVPLLLDDSGERLNPGRSGRQTGRMALFDVSIDGRWGGIISGDRVVLDYDPSPSGRHGPAVLEIGRYSELQGGDDKLTCAGTIESFVRGAVDA